jgi:hypothetical protein
MLTPIAIPDVNLRFGACGGIEGLLGAIEPAWHLPDEVVLDFGGCKFISAHGVAVLVTLKLQRDRVGWPTRIDWDTLRPPVAKQFGRWRVSPLFGGELHPWTDNAIPLLHLSQRDPAAMGGYVQQWIVGHRDMPAMTTGLAKVTAQAFCEVFGNIFRHADSAVGGIAIGQVYPNVKEFQVCICDGGVGLVERVQRAGYGRESAPAAIGWAMQEGHSTAPGGQPGGLGLFWLRRIVQVNGGNFRTYANAGFYSEYGGRPFGTTMAARLPGTLTEIRLKVRDDMTYTLG